MIRFPSILVQYELSMYINLHLLIFLVMRIVLSYYVINGTQRKFEYRYLALCILKKYARASAKFEADSILLCPYPPTPTVSERLQNT